MGTREKCKCEMENGMSGSRGDRAVQHEGIDEATLDDTLSEELFDDARWRGEELGGALMVMLSRKMDQHGIEFDDLNEESRHRLMRVLFDGLMTGVLEAAERGDEICEESAFRGADRALERWDRNRDGGLGGSHRNFVDGEYGQEGDEGDVEWQLMQFVIDSRLSKRGQILERAVEEVSVMALGKGRIGIGFETPDQFAARETSTPSDQLAEEYADWWRTAFTRVLLAGLSLLKSGVDGVSEVVVYDAGAHRIKVGSSTKIRAAEPLNGVCVELSKHDERGTGKAVKCDVFVVVVSSGTAIGCVLLGKNCDNEVVWQKNVFGFPLECIETSTWVEFTEYQRGVGERIAQQEGLAIRFVGLVELAMCAAHRMMVCPEIEGGAEVESRGIALH